LKISSNIISGYNNFDVFIAKYDYSGNARWAKAYGLSTSNDVIKDIVLDNNKNVIISGTYVDNTTFDNNSLVGIGLNDVFIAKFQDPDSEVSVNDKNPDNSLNIYPVPASDYIIINLNNIINPDIKAEIYDLTGRKIYSNKTSYQNFKINVSNFDDGIYLLKLTGKDLNRTEKILIKH